MKDLLRCKEEKEISELKKYFDRKRTPRGERRVIYRFWHNGSENGRVGYIGKDCYFPRRLCLECRKKESSCKKLYQALNKYPLKTWNIEILAFGFQSDAIGEEEKFWIKKFNSKNKGYNCTDGGDGKSGCIPTEETRKKISKAQKGRKPTEEARRNMSKAQKGRKPTEETRKKMSKAHKGKKPTEETRRNMSKAHKGKKPTPEARRNMSKAQKRRRQREQSHENIGRESSGSNQAVGRTAQARICKR